MDNVLYTARGLSFTMKRYVGEVGVETQLKKFQS